MRILAISGDGVGTEVIPAAVDLMVLVCPKLSIETRLAGYQAWKKTGEAINEEILSFAASCDGILFGATATPSPPPEGYKSPILAMRKAFKYVANLRYCQSMLPGGMDVVIVRESSEGLYAGSERAIPDGFVAEHKVTRAATVEVAKAAADIARKRNNCVTIVHKANVLSKTEGFFRQVAIETLEQEKVSWNEALSDAAGYFLVKEPLKYDVMLMPNHTGDMLSDVAAAVAGGLGIVPSLSVGSGGPPLAEPIHGSAPDLVGKNAADPVAAIRSGALLLEFLGEKEAAERLDDAVRQHMVRRSEKMNWLASEILQDITENLKG